MRGLAIMAAVAACAACVSCDREHPSKLAGAWESESSGYVQAGSRLVGFGEDDRETLRLFADGSGIVTSPRYANGSPRGPAPGGFGLTWSVRDGEVCLFRAHTGNAWGDAVVAGRYAVSGGTLTITSEWGEATYKRAGK